VKCLWLKQSRGQNSRVVAGVAAFRPLTMWESIRLDTSVIAQGLPRDVPRFQKVTYEILSLVESPSTIYKYHRVHCLVVMQNSKTCPDCGCNDAEYRGSDRHRGFYTCEECTAEYTVDYYA